MPLYMDRHFAQGATAAEIEEAHLRDLEVQEKYGVRYLTYWFDDTRGNVFCLAEAPNAEAASAVHKEAHGLVANQIIPVNPDAVADFLGRLTDPPSNPQPISDSAFRTILFTDIVGSTELTQRHGDEQAMGVIKLHNQVVRDALASARGSEVKHTGDGIMASFALPSPAPSTARSPSSARCSSTTARRRMRRCTSALG